MEQSSTGTGMASPDVKEERNLSLIQRLDKDVIAIIGYASHAVVYLFKQEEKSWERENVEGTLFIVQRCSIPYHKLLVINRVSPTNLMQPITQGFKYEVNENFLIFQNEQGIRGIWFSKQEERTIIIQVFMGIMKTLHHTAQTKEKAEASPSTAHQIPQPGSTQTNASAATTEKFSSVNTNKSFLGQQTMESRNQTTQVQGQAALGIMSSPRGPRYSVPPGHMAPVPVAPPMYHPPYFQMNHPQSMIQHPIKYPNPPLQGSQGQDPFLLTKEQMQDVLFKLIKNDRFIELLHNEYVRSQKKKASKAELPK